MSETDRPIDHVVLCWARMARSVGEDVRVLQPGESGGVGQFANDELLSDGDLHWQRFYIDGGAIVIVPHDPVLDDLAGRRVRVERDGDGVLQVFPVRVSMAHALGAHHRDVSAQEARATVREDMSSPPTMNQTSTLHVEAADDAPTEIIPLDQMPTLNVRVEHMTRSPQDDQTREVRVNPELLIELCGGEATRDVSIDLDLLRRLDAAMSIRRTHEPERLEPLEQGRTPELGPESEELLEVEDTDQTWDVSIDPEFLASMNGEP